MVLNGAARLYQRCQRHYFMLVVKKEFQHFRLRRDSWLVRCRRRTPTVDPSTPLLERTLLPTSISDSPQVFDHRHLGQSIGRNDRQKVTIA